MTKEQIKTLEEQEIPMKYLGDLKFITKGETDPLWAALKGFCFGVIIGKREERERNRGK